MSFRTRLTVFFVLVVVIPMAAMGVLVYGLIDSSSSSKADARAAGVASAARSVYEEASRTASLTARGVARQLALVPPSRLRARAAVVARRDGLARLKMTIAGRAPLSLGDPSAIAPGIAVVRAAGSRPQRTVEVSTVTAAAFAAQLAGPGTEVVVREGAVTLGSSDATATRRALPAQRGTVVLGSARYRAITQQLPAFDAKNVNVTVLSALDATSGSASRDRTLAGVLIGGFLLLALVLALFVSRALQSQVLNFLEAARRLGSGDFSTRVETAGRDEFARLGAEFNSMSRQLSNRLDELEQERKRFRTSVRRIGEAFASGLDRDALLTLALRTAIDATESDRGRVSARSRGSEPLMQAEHVGTLTGLEQSLTEAERRAVESGAVGEAASGDFHVAAVALGRIDGDGPPHGVITVCREGRPFSDDDHELLRSLASRATLALTNVNTHIDVARQAVTDDLTGLASRGHLEELLDNEMREVARYGYSVAVAMFDIDNFKSVNDTYGHPQGDLVLRRVAEALRGVCRDADLPARYGGEEMALVLPHTDLDGAHELAERARTAIEGMAIPRLDHQGWLKITTSVGVAASADGRGDALVAAADNALYAAKRTGKNRTVRADRVGAARELASSAEPPIGE